MLKKRRTLSLWFSLATFATAILFLRTTAAQAQQRQALASRVAAPSNAQVLGPLSSTKRLELAISLPFRNQNQLDSLLQQLYDPASPQYRHFLTVQQFTQQFGPTLSDYSKVIAWAQSHHFVITHTFPSRNLLTVNAQVSDIETAFHLTMQVYQHPTENRHFFAPDVEPSVEVGLPILSVEGLSDFYLPHPMLKRAPLVSGVTSNTTGSGPGGQFLGSDMRAAYGGGTTLDGSGQVVGLIELGPYRYVDVQNYFSNLGQPLNVPIVNVLLGVNGVCGVGCDDGEEAIDIQQAIAMAPNLSALIVYEAYGGVQAISAYTQAANDDIAKQLSISFGWGGTPSTEAGYEQVFKQLEAQGQSSYVASGDAGANSGGGGYPGNSTNITDAGGTDLTTVSSGGAWQSETGWVGSGGGWNTAVPIPSWQSPVINSGNNGDPNYRNIPDVSAEANTDNYFCANGSCQGGIGGTSLAAPRWAAFTALINQQAAANANNGGSNPTLGFLNPTIYPDGQGGNYGSIFHDITSGQNPSSASPPLTCSYPNYGCLPSGIQGFNATAGFDDVTGWGSPNGPTIFDALFPATSNPNFTLSSSPGVLNVTPGQNGTSSITLTPLSGFSASTNLTVVIPGSPNSAPTGLNASLSSSSIAAGGGSVVLNVSTTSSTPGGTYTIAVVGISGSGCTTTPPGACLTQTAYVTVALPAFVGLSSTPAAGLVLNQGSTASSTITVVGINGFNSGSVSLTATGLPSGVTASFTPVNSTTGTSTMTLAASDTALLTQASKPYQITITGQAAGNTQATAVNVFLNPPTSGGSGTTVDLSSAYNVYGFYDDANISSITPANSLDGVGFTYSANLLNAGMDFNGTQFNFGPPNQPDSVVGKTSTGTILPPISLPAGYYTSLQMLATGIEGNQTSQTVTVTYSDASSQSFTQTFSDWCSKLASGCTNNTGPGTGEAVALAMPYRDSAGGPDNRIFYLYGYSFGLNPNKAVQSVTLPPNRNVVVLAATLAGQVSTGYTLSASPSTLNVPAGTNKTTTITVTPTGGFTGNVTLSASGLPSGVTASFSPNPTLTTSTLTLTASSSAPLGSATLTVTGTSGNVTQTTTINLTVVAAPSYSLAAGAATPASIAPGGSATATVAVTPSNGYTGSVTLSCSITPAVTPAPSCSFNMNPVSVQGANPVSPTLTFTTVGPSAAIFGAPGTFFAALLPISGFLLLGLCFVSEKSCRKALSRILPLWVLLACAAASGCGGGGNSSPPPGSPGTPAGSYTVTITGKDASGLSQSNSSPVTVVFTVN
jgi:hypothetical protein